MPVATPASVAVGETVEVSDPVGFVDMVVAESSVT